MLPPVGVPTNIKSASSFRDTAFSIAEENVFSPMRVYLEHFSFFNTLITGLSTAEFPPPLYLRSTIIVEYFFFDSDFFKSEAKSLMGYDGLSEQVLYEMRRTSSLIHAGRLPSLGGR